MRDVCRNKLTAHERHATCAHPIGSLSCMRQAVACWRKIRADRFACKSGAGVLPQWSRQAGRSGPASCEHFAVTTATRPEALSLREFVPSSEASAWFGIGASKRTPEPKLQARLTNLGGTVLGRSSADLAKLISDEVKT
jgi:hypothetical protein